MRQIAPRIRDHGDIERLRQVNDTFRLNLCFTKTPILWSKKIVQWDKPVLAEIIEAVRKHIFVDDYPMDDHSIGMLLFRDWPLEFYIQPLLTESSDHLLHVYDMWNPTV